MHSAGEQTPSSKTTKNCSKRGLNRGAVYSVCQGYIYMQNIRARFKKTKTNVCLINLVFHLGFTRLPTTTTKWGGGGGGQIFMSTR